MSTVDGASTPNQKSTRSKVVSSPVTENSKATHSELSKTNHAAGKRAVSTTPRELEGSLLQDDELLPEVDAIEYSQKSSQKSSQQTLMYDDESAEVSDAPLSGQNVVIQLGYSYPKIDPNNKTGIRVEMVVQERLKHIGFAELKAFLNEMGRNFFTIPEGDPSPILCREINGYIVPKTDKVCMFGKVLCKPDILFLKKLFSKAAVQSNFTFDKATFDSDEKAFQLAAPYFVSGEFVLFVGSGGECEYSIFLRTLCFWQVNIHSLVRCWSFLRERTFFRLLRKQVRLSGAFAGSITTSHLGRLPILMGKLLSITSRRTRSWCSCHLQMVQVPRLHLLHL